MKTDYEKLMIEDPDFKKYCEAACLQAMLAQRKGADSFFASMWSFYQMGMSMKDLRNWIRSISDVQLSEDDDDGIPV